MCILPFAFPYLTLSVEVAGGRYDGEGDAIAEGRVAHGEVGLESFAVAIHRFVGCHMLGDEDEVGVGGGVEFAKENLFRNEE